MEANATSYAWRQVCQVNGNIIHAPTVELHSLSIPWPFYTWALDLISPIWILPATQYYTKWVEIVTLRWASGAVVVNFILDNVICWFGIPKRILFDNSTSFVHVHVQQLLEEYGVHHGKSSPCYPKRKGQAEATNKTLLQTFSRMVYESQNSGRFTLSRAMGICTSKCTSTQATPFSFI